MISFIFGIVCALIALILWVLYRTYQHVPLKELKRLARGGDDVAALLYKPAAYGVSLRILLGGVLLISGVASLALLSSAVGLGVAILVLLVLAVIGNVTLVPAADLTKRSLWLAQKSAPAIAWLLERVHPLLDAATRFVRRHRPLSIHTGLYEKSDLIDLLNKQKIQPDNRIAPAEIDLLTHSLSFGDRQVADALVPKRVVKLVAASADIGPVLMADLHASGHSRFPVYDGDQDHIVGVLYLHDLVTTKQTGTVSGLMQSNLTYVHEDFSLFQTLQAFIKTKHHLFIVVNSFEEFVGIITIEDVLEQMIGTLIVDEFDRYDDLRAVATAAAKKDHAEHLHDKTEQKEASETTAVAPEVVK